MIYIKSFRLFEAEIGTDDIKSTSEDIGLQTDSKNTINSALEDAQKMIREFGEKKTKMETIFKDPKLSDDSSLESALLSGVYNGKKEAKSRNPWLTKFETVLRMERRKNSLQNSINKDMDQVKVTNDDIYRLDSESKNATSARKIQIVSMLEKNRKKLKELKDNINSNKRLLSQDIINWKKKHEDFKRDVKTEEDRIKNLLTKK
jgi:hypothetical protein